MRFARTAKFVALSLLLSLSTANGTTRLRPLQDERGAPPAIIYSTLLGGGNGGFDGISDLAVDAEGNAIVVGTTESSDFPLRNAMQDSLEGNSDAFVAKFDPTGALVFSTFLGGDESDGATAVAVDSTGAIFVAGTTSSNDFPLENAAQSTPGGSADAFVTKLASNGASIVYSTRLGGNGADAPRDIAVDAAGRAYVVGEVTALSGATTFPSVNPIQNGYGGGTTDAFATFLSTDGAAVLFSTLIDVGTLGGHNAGRDRVTSLSVNPDSGDVFVGGNFEISEDQPEIPFLGRLRPSDTDLGTTKPRAPQLYYNWIQLLMSQLDDPDIEPPEEFGIKFSIIWMIHLSRVTTTTPRPGRGGASEVTVLGDGLCHPATPGGNCDEPAVFAVYDPELAFGHATNLPLYREFFHDAIVKDEQGAIYIAGDISSDRLGAVNPFQPAFGGGDDAVVAVLAPGTLQKAMVSFLGGDGFDSPTSIAVDPQGNILVAGLTTLSTTFPTTPGALQTAPKGRNDGFLVKISAVGPFPEAPDFGLSFAEPNVTVARGSKITVTLDIERVGGFAGKVKVTPPAAVAGFKVPKKVSTSGSSVALKFKVKPDAPAGPTSFTFTGTDKDGRTRIEAPTPVADIAHAMRVAGGLDEAIASGLYADLDGDTAFAILEEAAKMADGVLAPLNRAGDLNGPRYANDEVKTAPGWIDAYRAWREAGWNALTGPTDFGGQGLPLLLGAAVAEMWHSSNMAFGLCPLLTAGAIEAVAAHGSDDLKERYLAKLISGEWTGTMNLTEPQAGSDLAALRAKAERAGDGTYRITGQKIFITYGEHDLTENICHLVLARLPDAPPGVKGISLFLAPKYLIDANGQPTIRNDLRASAIEHKLGIHGSPTCTMIFGDKGGATGYLIGEENRGLACMFTMMNNARLAVGLQGVGIAERAYQQALNYAGERRQGRAPNANGGGMSPIIDHPDVQRMLMTMRGYAKASRAICYMTAAALDRAHLEKSPDARKAAAERAALLTPIAKAFSTDIGVEAASLGVQTHGGMGFIEETGAAQHYRDARITTIYEGTNGIQSIDLVTRKLGANNGASVWKLLGELDGIVRQVETSNDPAFGTTGAKLREALSATERASKWLLERMASAPNDALAGATPYLRLFGSTLGGCLLAGEALAAKAGGEGEPLRYVALARFFAENIAVAAPALEKTVTDSADAVNGADTVLLG